MLDTDKHTPPPWYPGHLGNEEVNCDCRYIIAENGLMGGIGEVYLDNGLLISEGGNDAPDLETAIANMHLIAASPEMLDSLDMVWDAIDDLSGFYEDRNSEDFWETILVLKTNLKWIRNKARNNLKTKE